MSIRNGVLLMTSDAAVTSAVSRALATNGHVLTATSARDPRELFARLVAEPSPVALVDLDPQPQHTLVQLERIVERFPQTRFVALSNSIESDLLMQAMQAGVRRVLPKLSIPTELTAILNRLSPHDPAGGGPVGDVITILSASGGCGATTVAANLATELVAPNAGDSALLVDLDAYHGSLATYFGLTPEYAIDHIMDYERGLDTELIRSTATIHGPQLHLLASPASMRPPKTQPLNYGRLRDCLALASRGYRFTVIDAPRLPGDVTATLVANSTSVILLFQLTVKDLRVARGILDALDDRGISRGQVLPVANRYARRPAISLEEAGKVLGGAAVRYLRNDFSAALEGINYGRPLAQASPKSLLRRDLLDLLPALVPSLAQRGR
jgi:pilus assembly protein CpaE